MAPLTPGRSGEERALPTQPPAVERMLAPLPLLGLGREARVPEAQAVLTARPA
jgi:hypothetical protein